MAETEQPVLEGGNEDTLDTQSKAQLQEEEQFQLFFSRLTEYVKMCVRQENLAEAQLGKDRLRQLQAQYKKRRASMIRRRQNQERLALEQKERDELRQYEADQAQAFHEFHEKSLELDAMYKKNHQKEILDVRTRAIEDWDTQTHKWSSKLLNLRKIQGTLIKQGQFGEAAPCKAQADKLEAMELKLLRNVWKRDLMKREDNVLIRQQQELDVFRKRRNACADNMMAEQKKHINFMKQRYKNLRKDMTQRFVVELNLKKYEPSKNHITNEDNDSNRQSASAPASIESKGDGESPASLDFSEISGYIQSGKFPEFAWTETDRSNQIARHTRVMRKSKTANGGLKKNLKGKKFGVRKKDKRLSATERKQKILGEYLKELALIEDTPKDPSRSSLKLGMYFS